MATFTFKGSPAHTNGELPKIGDIFHFSDLIKNDLSAVSHTDFAGKHKVISIFPSIDTGVCAASVRKFNQEAAALKDTVVLNVSLDLPFANARFCGAEGIANCITLSAFRSDFGNKSGLIVTDTPLKGLLARAVIVTDKNDKVTHVELVAELGHEPNYEAALKAVK